MRLRLAHVSMQFSDSPKQMREDVDRIFDRARAFGYAWITGTEAGPGAEPLTDLLREEGRASGYRFWKPARPTDCWIAVNRDLIDGGWETDYEPVIPGSGSLPHSVTEGRRWGPKGLVTVAFDNDELGRINVGAAHYLTGARGPGSPRWDWNRRLGLKVGEWAARVGRGKALAFYGGDQNMADSKNREPQGDTFFGAPLTSCWDELGKYENTGHGPIDVIASYDRDGRVSCRSARALDDREFPLHTDHFLVEAVYDVKELKA